MKTAFRHGRVALALLAPVWFVGVDIALAQTARTWNGSVSSDWFNSTNWIPAGVPASDDIVNFTNGAITLTAPVTINGQFNWSGGTLSGNALTIATNGLLTLSGGATHYLENALTNAGTVVMTNSGGLIVSFYSLFGYSGLIENLPGALWDIQNDQTISPYYVGPAYFHNAGTVRKSGQTGTTTINVPFNNSASVTALQGTLNFGGGGTLAGTFAATNAASILFSGGNFTNSAPTTISGPGVVQLTGGNLTLLTDVIATLPLAGGNLILGPAFQGGAITNLTLSGSTLLSTNTVTGTFDWIAGSLMAPLTIATNGLLTLSGGATHYLENALTNAGTVVMTNSGGLIVSYDSLADYFGLVENLPGALWDIQNDQTISPNYIGPAYFHNAGTFRKSGQTGATTVYVPFNNSASVTALQGTLNFGGGGTLAGTFAATNAASILFSGGNFTNSAPTTISGPGVVQLTGGNLTLLTDVIATLPLAGGNLILGPAFQGGAITNLTLSGSTLLSTNTVTGAFDWIAGSLIAPLTIATNGLLTLSGGATHYLENALTNAGTVVMTNSGGLIVSYDSLADYFGLIENLPGALWDIQNDQTISPNYTGPAYFHNAGTFRKSGHAGTTTIYVPFYNSGTVTPQTGTVALDGGFTPTGGELLFGLSSPASYGRISISGNATLGGTVGVVWLNGFVPTSGNAFTVLDYGSFTGTFTNTDLPAAALWQTNYGPTSFTISVASINQLAFTLEPVGGILTNITLAPVVVQVEDPSGNPIATNGVPVTLSLNSGIGTLSGTLAQNTDPTGKATFNDLRISLIGTKTLRAASPGLTAATSTVFVIVPLIGTQWTGGGFALQLNGTNSLGFTIISTSTNLMSWTPIYTNAPTNGAIIFLDPASTNFPDRFYRIVQQ